MYSKILVPLDGSHFSEQILPYARFFAEAFKIPVDLLHLTNPDARPPFWPEPSGDQYLKEIAAKYFMPSCRITVTAQTAQPAEAIIERAKGDPSCLIAMATHGTSGLRRWLIGSVASRVVRTAANPLLLIRPGENIDAAMPIRLDTVFVPLDGSGLAEKALAHVRALAKAIKVEIHLLRFYTAPADAYVVANGVIDQGPAQYREELEREAQTYVDGMARVLRAEGFERVVATAREGDPAGAIIDLARTTSNSLIAMSTHGRSGIGRWLLGSVAERIIQHSQDPVLVIRAS